jgi:hypothetical protein
MARRTWTRNELIVAFNLYCKLRFGQCHGRNPQVIQLATLLGRTPNAVAMKLCNFASFDPAHQRRGVAGLGNVSRTDITIWEEFNANWNSLATESERAYRELLGEQFPRPIEEEQGAGQLDPTSLDLSGKQTETQAVQTVRLGQAFFRSAVLASYNDQCCICLMPCRELLIASHIVPWAARADLRLDPRNGLCLCALHDKAFDRGLISVDGEFHILVSRRIETHLPHPLIDSLFLQLRGSSIHRPEKFEPDPLHLEFHRSTIYQAG